MVKKILKSPPVTNHSVHPHVRGDNYNCRRVFRYCPGSPPRAWGQLPAIIPGDNCERFTPTCVGTTEASHPLWRLHNWVHPHVSGDNVRLVLVSGHLSRFTPTCVGTTAFPGPGRSRAPVHPHVRGDNHFSPPVARAMIGSPPRAWGQLSRGLQ